MPDAKPEAATSKRRSQTSPEQDAIEHGLTIDEGVNEDRSGAQGPTLEEGAETPHAPRPQAGTTDARRKPAP